MRKFLSAFGRAIWNILNDITVDIAGYIAYMSFLALFPFLILLMLLASYIGSMEAAQLTIQEFFQVLPPQVVEAISPIIQEVTQSPQASVITIAIVAILWISTSSIEALRVGLNHAYQLHEERSFFFRRFQSLVFVMIGALSFIFALVLLVLLPLLLQLWQYIEEHLKYVPDLPSEISSRLNMIRVITAYSAVLIWTTLNYKFLPNHKVKLSDCLTGAIIASFLWLIAAGLFSLYLQNIARYDVLYGSLGGVVVTLIFFHISASLVLLGGHINKELSQR